MGPERLLLPRGNLRVGMTVMRRVARLVCVGVALHAGGSSAIAAAHGSPARGALNGDVVAFEEDEDGHALALLNTVESGYIVRTEVFRSEDDGATWATVARFKDRLAMTFLRAEDGTLHVVMADRSRHTAVVRSSKDGGKTWLPEATIGGWIPAFTSLAEDHDGRLIAAGKEHEKDSRRVRWVVFSSEDRGTTWRKVSPPPVDDHDSVASSVAIDGDGSWMIAGRAWSQEDRQVWRVQVTRDGGRSWTDEEPYRCSGVTAPGFFRDAGGALYLGGSCDVLNGSDVKIREWASGSWSEVARIRLPSINAVFRDFVKVGDEIFSAGGEILYEDWTALVLRITDSSAYHVADGWSHSHSLGLAIRQLRSGTILVGGYRGREAIVRRSGDLGLTWDRTI
jgi:hypothetical protein